MPTANESRLARHPHIHFLHLPRHAGGTGGTRQKGLPTTAPPVRERRICDDQASARTGTVRIVTPWEWA